MKYFLTGATGFIGGVLARLLVAAGHQVVAVVRNPTKAQGLRDLGIDLVQGDVTDKESMRAPMRGVDGVYHVAGWYKIGVRSNGEGEKINVQGTLNVLELIREMGIARGVYTSTLAINSDTHGQMVDEQYHFQGKHLSEYDRTKAAAHKIAEEMCARGLPLVIVMPGLVYGPGDTSSMRKTLIQYLQRKLPMIPQQTAFSWAHVEDVARAHMLAMEKGRSGESYLICGPCHTLLQALQIAQKISGIAVPRTVSPGVVSLMSKMMGLVDPWLPLPESYTAEGLRIIAGVTYLGNNAKARRELGYAPRPLAEGLKETLLHEMQLLGMTRKD